MTFFITPFHYTDCFSVRQIGYGGKDLLHKLEIENLTRDERAKLATELRDCRRLRRKYKDVVEELEPIAGYCGTAAGMQAVKQLSRFVGELRKVENYHQNRHYVPRSGRVKGESQDAE